MSETKTEEKLVCKCCGWSGAYSGLAGLPDNPMCPSCRAVYMKPFPKLPLHLEEQARAIHLRNNPDEYPD